MMSPLPLRRRDGADEVNIAPLIDMVFILLIFFMVSTTFVRDAELDLERPGASTDEVADARALRVQVDSRGGVYLAGLPVKPWMLEGRVRDALAHQRYQNVLVVADRYVDTGTLVEVVDACRLGGAQHVGVAVEHEG
ncbi:MAG: biopolymer transporter ExbD [Pseudomonadota bacterium]